jgi:hypothetical protein
MIALVSIAADLVVAILVRLALTGTPCASWYVGCYAWPTMPKSKPDPWHFARPENMGFRVTPTPKCNGRVNFRAIWGHVGIQR